jgi:hypothetical protein
VFAQIGKYGRMTCSCAFPLSDQDFLLLGADIRYSFPSEEPDSNLALLIQIASTLVDPSKTLIFMIECPFAFIVLFNVFRAILAFPISLFL